jgi:hypothetical protein
MNIRRCALVAGLALPLSLATASDAQFAGFTDVPMFSEGFARPVDVVLEDVDRDGDLDAVLAESRTDLADTVAIAFGDGAGGFAAPVRFSVGERPRGANVADFNRDGRPDIVVVNESFADMSILFGLGGGAFLPETIFPTGAGPRDTVIDDFNRDGAPDIAVAVSGASEIRVFSGDGAGGFSIADYAAPAAPLTITAADFNNDGAPDLLTSNGFSNTMTLFVNQGDGTFASGASALTLPAQTNTQGAEAGDFNGDGWMDIIVANRESDTIQVFLNNRVTPSPSFALATTISPMGINGPLRFALADYDRDGDLDAAVAAESLPDQFVVLLNNGAAIFQVFSTTQVQGANDVAAGDVDRDGDVDLVILGNFFERFALFRNQEVVIPACAPDLSGDGVVGAADLAELIGSWGPCP